jgi:hypothetical protein
MPDPPKTWVISRVSQRSFSLSGPQFFGSLIEHYALLDPVRAITPRSSVRSSSRASSWGEIATTSSLTFRRRR